MLEALPQQSDDDLSIAKLDSKFRRAQDERSAYLREWRINLAAFDGDQYIAYNHRTQRVDRLPKGARHRVRLTDNQIQPLVLALLARMERNRAIIEADPVDQTPTHQLSARYAEMLFEHVWESQKLGEKDEEALLLSFICGQGYWEVYWDKTDGEKRHYIIDPETGEPVGDPGREEALRQLATAGAIELQWGSYNIGDIGVEVLSPFDLIVIGAKDPQDNRAREAIKVMGYRPEEVKRRWGVEVRADGQTDVSIPEKGQAQQQLVTVKSYYKLPDHHNPEGAYVVWAGGRQLHRGPYPYRMKRLPFVRFAGTPAPKRDYNSALVRQLLPLQKELNRTISQIVEYKNLTVRPQLIAVVGSLTHKITDEPGAVILVNPGPAGEMPKYREVPNLPAYVLEHLRHIIERMADLVGLHEVSKAQTPPNVEAGVAIAQLQEADDTRLGLRVHAHERALADAGNLMLALAKQFYVEERKISVRVATGSAQRAFMNTQLEGCKGIRAVPGSSLPKSKAAERQMYMQLMQNGTMPPEKALPLMDLASTGELVAKWQMHKNKQHRELERALRGEPIPEPAEWENHAEHLEVLEEALNGAEFDAMPEEYQQAVIEHYMAHREALSAQEPKQLPEGVRIQVQARTELATEQGIEALNEAGMNLDPAQGAANHSAMVAEQEETAAAARAAEHEQKLMADLATQMAAPQPQEAA
jgi:hypothetical protein